MADYFSAVAVAAELQMPHEAVLHAAVAAGATSIEIDFASNSLPQEWAVGATIGLDYRNMVAREAFVVGSLTGDANPFTVTLSDGAALSRAHSAGAPIRDITQMALVVEPMSRWMDRQCQLEDNAFAREDVSGEIGECAVNNNGDVVIQAHKATVNSIASLTIQAGPDVEPVAVSDLARVWVKNKYMLIVPQSAIGTLTGGLVPGGFSGWRGRRLRYTLNYNGGYSPIPSDLQRAGVIMAARALKSAQVGYSDVVGASDTGAPIYSSAIPKEARVIFDRYQRWVSWVG